MPPSTLGLALGSGSARGLAHIGILRVLDEARIPVGCVAGSSIGAVVGALYLAGKLDEYEQLMRALDKRRVLGFLDTVVPSSGVFGGQRLTEVLRSLLEDLRIEDLPVPYCALATDVETGREVRLQRGDLVDALRASFSLPGMFVPQRLDGRWLVDGGVVSPVPTDAARALGADRVLAVSVQRGVVPRDDSRAEQEMEAALSDVGTETTEGAPDLDGGPETPTEEDARLSPRLRRFLAEARRSGADARQSIAERATALTSRFSRGSDDRPPSIRYVLHSSFLAMQSRLAELAITTGEADLVLEPRLPHISLLHFDQAAEIIAAGEEVARAARPRIEALLDTGPGGDDRGRSC